jgi:hypothetical protein
MVGCHLTRCLLADDIMMQNTVTHMDQATLMVERALPHPNLQALHYQIPLMVQLTLHQPREYHSLRTTAPDQTRILSLDIQLLRVRPWYR